MKFEINIPWISTTPCVRSTNIDGKEYQLLSGVLPGGLKINSDISEYNIIVKLRKQLDDLGVNTSDMIFGVLAKDSKTQLAAFVTQWIEEEVRQDVFIVSERGLKAKSMVVHEAAHLKQIASGRLVLHPEKVVWEGHEYHGHSDGTDVTRILEYLNYPWEREAYEAQWASSKVASLIPFKVWFALNYKMPYGTLEWFMKRKKMKK